MASGLRLCIDAVSYSVPAVLVRQMASTRMPVGAFPLRQAKVDEDTTALGGIVEKVCWLDVAMDDPLGMHRPQSSEQAAEVEAHLGNLHVAVVVAEVVVLEVGQHSHHLVQMAEGGDERTHRVGIPQVVEQLELVEDANGTAGDVDLLDGYIMRPSGGPSRRCPRAVLAGVDVPRIVELVVFQVLCLVHSREGAWANA